MQPRIFNQMTALADGVRSRVLLLLDGRELTVSELCAVLQLPQSTASRHLKTLGEAGWVVSRRDGTNRFYTRAEDLDERSRGLWSLTHEQIAEAPASAQDQERLREVLAERRTKTREFFAGAAADWDRVRTELFGEGFQRMALLGLLDPDWVVADLGCGTGVVAEALAPFVARVIGVDGSAEMIDAARTRLAGRDHVELQRNDLEHLSIADGSVDAVTMVLVLHHLADPARVLAEVGRVLRPGGRALIVDMLPHDRSEYQQEMGHLWLGFTREQLERFLRPAGLRLDRFEPLPADPQARGPLLFAATCRLNSSFQ